MYEKALQQIVAEEVLTNAMSTGVRSITPDIRLIKAPYPAVEDPMLYDLAKEYLTDEQIKCLFLERNIEL